MHTQLDKERRIELGALVRAGNSPRQCAKELGMDKSAITREIKRNKDEDGMYRGASAHKRHLSRRRDAKQCSLKIENDASLRRHIRKRLSKRDSPEQIAGRIALTGSHQPISHETIYQWIFNEEPMLKKHLRRIGRKGKYRRKRGTKIREKQRDEAKIRRIDTRPQEVETRERIGDWEGDTIIGKERTVRMMTNVERKSGYGLIDKLAVVIAPVMRDRLRTRFRRIARSKRKTFTYDNGTGYFLYLPGQQIGHVGRWTLLYHLCPRLQTVSSPLPAFFFAM